MNPDNYSNKNNGWYIDLGFMDYDKALKIQKDLHQKRIAGIIPDTIILVEHPPVITLGKSGNSANLLVPNETLEKKGITVYRIERGGDVTYHGPGQLVGYPIFYLKETLAGIRGVIERLESALIATLADFQIEASTKPKFIGVWKGDEKIASIGIAVKKWVTFHGFALNVSTDLSYFDLIKPCGLSDVRMTSMAKILKKKLDLAQIKARTIANFEQVFGKKFQKQENLEKLTP